MDKPPKDQPDGAKPGDSEKLPNSNYAYDADAKAKQREEAPVTIGERVFRRVKKSWDVTRELRKLLRTQERAGDKIARLEAQKDAKTEKIRGVRDLDTGGWESYPLTDEEAIAAIETEVDALDAQVDELSEQSDQAAYDMIRLLLRDTRSDDERAADVAKAREELQAAQAANDEDRATRAQIELEDAQSAKPSDYFLKERLDASEAAELVQLLTSGREPDPTPATPSS